MAHSTTAELVLRLRDGLSGPAGKASAALNKFSAAESELKAQAEKLAAATKKLANLGQLDAKLQATTGRLSEQEAKVRQLAQAMGSVEKPTKAMKAALDNAERQVRSTTNSIEKQKTQVAQVRAEFERLSGSALHNVASAEAQVRERIDQTTAAMKRQAEATARAQRLQERSAGRRQAVRDAVGAAGMFAGPLILHETEEVVKRGAELAAALNRIRNVSGSEKEVQAAQAVAGKAARAYPLTTRTQSLEDYGELRSLAVNPHGGGVNEAALERNVMLMARTRTALASSGYSMEEGEAKSLAQALEGSGRALDPAAQSRMMDAYVRAKQVFGNAISAAAIRDFVQNAKASNFSSSDESFYFTTFARLAQGNASRLGNEFAQTMQTLVGGHMTKQGAEWLAKNGIIRPDQIRNGGGGKFYIAGKLKDQDLLSSDNTAWAQQVLLPGIQHSGALSQKNVSARMEQLRRMELRANPNAQIDEETLHERATHGLIADYVMKSGFRSTVADNLTHAIANALQTAKDVEQMKNATGLKAADNVAKNPIAAFNEFTSALSTFSSVLAQPVMQSAGGTMHSLADGLSSLTISLEEFQKANPIGAKALAGGALLAGGGIGAKLTWNLFSNLFRGGFGLTGSATALTGAATQLEAAAIALGAKGVLPSGATTAATAAEAAAGGAALSAGEVAVLGTGAATLAAAVALIKASKAAQEPGKGGAYAPPTLATRPEDEKRLADMRAELGGVDAQIKSTLEKSKNVDAAEMLVRPLRDRAQELRNEIELLTKSLKELREKTAPAASGWNDAYKGAASPINFVQDGGAGSDDGASQGSRRSNPDVPDNDVSGRSAGKNLGRSRSAMMSYAMDQLRREGVRDQNLRAAAAHLVGQADMESGLDPNKTHDHGTGYGIYGARLQRRTKMLQWLKQNGYPANSAEGQMRYMAHDAMSGRYPRTRRTLMNATPEGLAAGSRTITHEFEAPAIDNDRSGAVKRAFRGGALDPQLGQQSDQPDAVYPRRATPEAGASPKGGPNARDELDVLNDMSASPAIDASGVHSFISAVRTARSELEALHGVRAKSIHMASADNFRVPSLRSAGTGTFSSGPQQGE